MNFERLRYCDNLDSDLENASLNDRRATNSVLKNKSSPTKM